MNQTTAAEYAEYAYTLLEQGEVEEAIEPARLALAIDSHCAAALYVLGYALFLEGEPDEAFVHLEHLVVTAPEYPDAEWVRACMINRLWGERDERVLSAYDAALARDPANVYAQVQRAGIYRAVGRHEEARAVYERFSQPEHCTDDFLRLDCRFQLGCVLMVLGENEKAHKAFQAVVDVAPDFPDARMMLEMTSGEVIASKTESRP